ncbi:hypothetical protein M422DRAFT_243343 [Sphaerobolus stellatus SS14]|nr:hypothetical protein M422DRAFT_243343 [Sphaerobolus stellatus SS14]
MSFSGSSLDQGARLDRKSFMNKTHSRQEYSQKKLLPLDTVQSRSPTRTSKHAAPTLVTKTQTSPNRQPSPTRSAASTSRNRSARSTTANNAPENEEDLASNLSFASAATGQEPGAVRYARLKQRNQALGNSSYHSSGPGIIISPPNGENLRDTSVNVATAFHQAVSNNMPSGSGQKDSHLIQSRRIAAPPSKSRFWNGELVLKAL